ncbi:hypothetical protein PIB30_071366, partial [Stylosanthes scabra]|nr:hypothetical protein [Stylosanthes scabra]
VVMGHAYAPTVTLMRGQSRLCAAQLSKRQQSSRICVNIIRPLTHMRESRSWEFSET